MDNFEILEDSLPLPKGYGSKDKQSWYLIQKIIILIILEL